MDFGLVRFASRQIARFKAARNARRTIEALSALSERQLQDIGLSRSNIVSTAVQIASRNQMIDVK
ncbi:MAG: DUF1127 domain-containing protein [Alphaproteobacteria bacterium]|nr:DUF1127 domain-containing protein [Alphaproteobacteria bacterium]